MPLAIYTRSPYFITVTGVAADATRCDLYIWNDPDSVPATPTKQLDKPIAYGTTANFDVSPYLREYITNKAYVAVTADTVKPVAEYCWVTIKTYLNDVLDTTYTAVLCLDGYGYFTDGSNPVLGVISAIPPFMTQGTYYTKETETGGLTYFDNQAVTWEAKWTGIGTVTSTTTVTLGQTMGYIPYIHPTYTGTGGNNLLIIRNSVTVGTYVFKEVCESKYTPIDCDFINRFGVWQRLIFFKANHKEMTMSNNEYSLMPASLTYDVQNPIKQTFNVNAQESITCNTDWVVEGYSEVMKELLLSETILLDDRPVKLTTKNVKLMTHLNDKLINYEVKFEYSNLMLNYII